MTYADGSPLTLGDIVFVSLPGTRARGRIVMRGDTGEHLDLEESFVAWVESERLLEPNHVVVEWLDQNPFAHNDPRYAPTGNRMFTALDDCITRAA